MFVDNTFEKQECSECLRLVDELIEPYKLLEPEKIIEDPQYLEHKKSVLIKITACEDHCHECKLLSFRMVDNLKCYCHRPDNVKYKSFDDYCKSKGIFTDKRSIVYKNVVEKEFEYINSGRMLPIDYKCQLINRVHWTNNMRPSFLRKFNKIYKNQLD